MAIKTYKGMDKDMKCHGGFQYEPGQTYEADRAILCSDSGFHSCEAPFDVLRYFGLENRNRYFETEADGEIDKKEKGDTKLASSKLTIGTEIGLPGLIKAQIKYTKEKAESRTIGGVRSKLSGGEWSKLVGDSYSNLVGGSYSKLVGGVRSNLVGGDCSKLVGDVRSNLVGGVRSNLVGGDYSNLVGGDCSKLVGGVRSNLVGGDCSNLVGGDCSKLVGGVRSKLVGDSYSKLVGSECSAIIGRDGCKAKAGKNSVICLSEFKWVGDEYIPVSVKAVIVDGKTIKADTWYTLKDGEFVEAEEQE